MSRRRATFGSVRRLPSGRWQARYTGPDLARHLAEMDSRVVGSAVGSALNGKPVLLKRGMAATIHDLLLSAEYILAEGNSQVILCERGVRSFDTATRNMLDLSAIPTVHQLSHLPIVADPSHGTGLRDKVGPMARAALAAGADGLLIEVHPAPDRALSDGAQSLYPEQFAALMDELRGVAAAIGREVPQHAGTARV